jgi:hypothetical protein
MRAEANPGYPADYSNIESLVLRARPEKIDFAVNECHGVMEYWSAGIMGLVE